MHCKDTIIFKNHKQINQLMKCLPIHLIWSTCSCWTNQKKRTLISQYPFLFLVERQINLSNIFIKNFAKVVEFGQKMKMRI